MSDTPDIEDLLDAYGHRCGHAGYCFGKSGNEFAPNAVTARSEAMVLRGKIMAEVKHVTSKFPVVESFSFGEPEG